MITYVIGESTDISMDVNLSIISDDDSNYYNNSDGKTDHSNREDELQIHSKKKQRSPLNQVLITVKYQANGIYL